MFSGLQNLVKRKQQVETASAPVESTTHRAGTAATASSTAAPSAQPLASGTDPYALARDAVARRTAADTACVDGVQEQGTVPVMAAAASTPSPQAGVKRPRSSSPPSADDAAEACVPPSASSSFPASATPLMSEAEFDAQKTRVLDAIAIALADARALVQKEMARVTATTTKAPTRAVPLTLVLPHALTHFLEEEYILEVKKEGAPVTSWPEATEAELLLNLHASKKNDEKSEKGENSEKGDGTTHAPDPVSVADAHVRVAPAAAEVRAVLHILWYRLLAHWQASLTGTLITSGEATTAMARSSVISSEDSDAEKHMRGWSYPVYLLSVNALPDEVKYTKGQRISHALASWRTAKSARWHYLRLMAVLSADYETLQRARHHNSISDALEAECYLPQALRHHLYTMLVLHLTSDGNTAQAQQDYAEMTMGNANWKLGLFSAGEVHMRRSMEKVERNRIAHLLNNEPAMQMLRSMKEIAFSHATSTGS